VFGARLRGGPVSSIPLGAINLPRFLHRCSNFLGSLRNFWFIIVMTLLSYIAETPVILYLVAIGDDSDHGGPLKNAEISTMVFFGLLFAPVFETFLNQWLPIRLLNTKFKVNRTITILVSAASFGAMHGYSSIYVAETFFVGLVLAYAFVLKDRGRGSPFWLVATIHALRNAIALALTIVG
jgi:hypothetical protein